MKLEILILLFNLQNLLNYNFYRKEISIMSKKSKKQKLMPGEIKENNIKIEENCQRQHLQTAYIHGNGIVECTGKVINITRNRILFKYINIRFTNNEGKILKGNEKHIWVYDIKPFIKNHIYKGDKISFTAEIYPYLRKNNKKDYRLKNCTNITKINHHKKTSTNQIICNELCLFKDHCNGFCINPNM